MQELSLVEGAQRRDFGDVVWQIAERRGCDEVVVRYDCGHAIRADVWAPALPRTREYGMKEAERRRFMQHSLFVLTKDPGAPKVQITVPDGRCRHCGRGQRQLLICGPLQMDLADLVTSARLELPLSSHAFLAAMGQVCRLPENITPPPLLQGGLAQGAAIRPFDGPPLPREGVKQWSRKEVEDELKSEMVKYVGSATCVLLFVIVECIYICIAHLGPLGPSGFNDTFSTTLSTTGQLQNLSSVTSVEFGISNSTWVHRVFGPSEPAGDGAEEGTGSLFWSLLVHPLWVVASAVLAPMLWVLDLVVAVPRFLLLHVFLAVLRGFILRPCLWLLSFLIDVLSNLAVLLFRCVFSRPTAVLSQIPLTNPMVVAMALSLVVAALSAPQPPSFSLPSVWGDLPSLELTRGLKVLSLRLRIFWASARKDSRPKGGLRGVAAARQKGHAENRSARGEKAEAPGRPERPQAGQRDGGKAQVEQRSSGDKQSAPACFVCLDRPSQYLLEPCGHRVVCGDCAVQLVEAAARNRSISEAAGGTHHSSERGGACPSCGLAITRDRKSVV